MRLRTILLPSIVIALAGGGAVFAGKWAVDQIEAESLDEVEHALDLEGIEWAAVEVDGLLVTVTGTAADEAARFRALATAGRVVDAARVRDGIEVRVPEQMAAPEFTIEFLRNGNEISFFGLIPEEVDRDAIRAAVADAAPDAEVSDLLQTADFATPSGWQDALDFAVEALGDLPRSKVSASPREVTVTAITDSRADRATTEARLNVAAPATIRLILDISAPRPVISPFTLRAILDDQGLRFDACTADTEEARDAILSAARTVELRGQVNCTIGLGAPSAEWADASVAGISTLVQLGGGTVTFSDGDVTLIAAPGTGEESFDRAIGEFESALPEAFTLEAVLPETGDGSDSAIPEFVAILAGGGGVELRGRLPDPLTRTTVESYAKSRFGADDLVSGTRLDPALPEGWPVRVLAGLEALSVLYEGQVRVEPNFVEIEGVTGDPDGQAEISRLLSEKLGQGEDFAIDVSYNEAFDPIAQLPTPEECLSKIETIQREMPKITFAPSSPDIEPAGLETVAKIAEVLKDCQTVKIEIAGHTDSQGRESMNLNLSQARADAVLNAIMAERVLTKNLVAKGYGETDPIGDNETEEGREENRRIEFRAILAEQVQEAEEIEEVSAEGEVSAEEEAEETEVAEESE
ncbi:MAG: OmpA family protein [Pseudomonadota bacterium]